MAFARMTGLALVILILGAAVPAGAGPASMDKQEIEKIVRQYILDHPEVISEAIDRLREQEKKAHEEAQKQALIKFRPQIYDDPNSPVSGNPEGDVTMVEFFDYQCTYCKHVFPAFMNIMKTDKNVRVVWKELPILGPVSRFAARAAMAANKQGKYLPYHIALMKLRGRLTEDRVMETAHEVGLDIPQLVKDMASPDIAMNLNKNLQLARSLGIAGTPAFVIGDQLIPGAVEEDELRRLIAEHRESKG